MCDTLDHTCINPNQLRHYVDRVQDKPISESTLSLITEYGEFIMELSMEETIVFSNTHTPSDKQLQECLHINIRSPHPWDPMKVSFPKFSQSLED